MIFSGTLGGQAIGYDEATDAGPLGKQAALRFYIPAITRYMYGIVQGPHLGVTTPVPYTASVYMKTSGKGGTGPLVEILIPSVNGAGAQVQNTWDISDSGETVWTRKTLTVTPISTARGIQPTLYINSAFTATGTGWIMLPQLEQGSGVTAWRNAPADDAPIVWRLLASALTNVTTTSVSIVEIDSRNLAANLPIPWDANVTIQFSGGMSNSAAGNVMYYAPVFDGVQQGGMACHAPVAGYLTNLSSLGRVQVAAGKHRFAAGYATSGGTVTADLADNMHLIITAYRGK